MISLSADDMPTLVRGDSARLVQIFANLISNSIKFTTSKFCYHLYLLLFFHDLKKMATLQLATLFFVDGARV